MFVLLEILIVFGLVALAGSYLLRGRRHQARQELQAQRVEAYMQTIRREGTNAELNAMTDLELRDVLFASARNLRIQSERRWYLLVAGVALGFFTAIMVGTQEGSRGFAIAIVVAAVVLYGLNEYVGRRLRQPLEARGIDPERLMVE